MIVDIIKAFLIGGVICGIGQLFIDYTKLTPARILTGYVVAGVLISAVGLYKPLVDFAGAGATVPLTGFGHTLAEGIRRAIKEDGFVGIFTGRHDCRFRRYYRCAPFRTYRFGCF